MFLGGNFKQALLSWISDEVVNISKGTNGTYRFPCGPGSLEVRLAGSTDTCSSPVASSTRNYRTPADSCSCSTQPSWKVRPAANSPPSPHSPGRTCTWNKKPLRTNRLKMKWRSLCSFLLMKITAGVHCNRQLSRNYPPVHPCRIFHRHVSVSLLDL